MMTDNPETPPDEETPPSKPKRPTPARNLFSNAITTGIVFAFSLVSSVVTARWLGPEGRGVFAVVLLPSGLIMPLALMGFGSSVRYSIARKKNAPSEIIVSAVFIALLHATATGATLAALAKYGLLGKVTDGLPLNIGIATLLLLPIDAVTGMFSRILVGDSQFNINNFITLMQQIGRCVLLLLLVGLFDLGLWGAVATIWIVRLTALMISGIAVIRLFRPQLKIDFSFIRFGYHYGIRVWTSGAVEKANFRIDQLFIAMFLDKASLAQYAVATTIAELAWKPMSILSPVLFNQVAARKKGTQNELVMRIHRLIFVVGIAVALGIGLMAYPVIPLLFGEEYLPAVSLLLLLLPGTVVIGSYKTLELFFNAQGRPLVSTMTQCLGLLVSLIGFPLLLPIYGAQGAAVISSATYFVSALAIMGVFLWVTKENAYSLFRIHRADFVWVKSQLKSGMSR